MNELTIYKCDSRGEVLWQYKGYMISHLDNEIVIDSLFNREDIPFQNIEIIKNDHFIETFYTDRWYNIFEIHDRDDGRIKGWYCNIGRPAVLKRKTSLFYEDLALDLWVTPDGSQQVLDEIEFAQLDLDETVREKAQSALVELQDLFYKKFQGGS